MHIAKIILKNFKSFIGEHELNLSEGINFFVGNNNCGKTTVFKAIEFIQAGKNKEDFITKGKENEDISVEVEFRGPDIKDIINDENLNLKKYQDYVIDNQDGTFSLKLLRSSTNTSIVQGKKTVNLDIKNIRVYNPNSEETGIKKYENPTGIDRTITALFDAQFVYSDLKNEEYQDFGKTKVIGKIINDITKDFQKELDEDGNKTVWGEFKDAHTKAFGDNGLLGILKDLECSITEILNEQYGEGEVKFNFGLPEIDNFFKTGDVILSDNGISTPVSQKGTGMQRALALSLIQLYAKITNKSEGTIEKPIIFLIDEPETFLHPKAQNKLMEAFNELSKKSQILITTHSPYLLKLFDKNKHQLSIFYKDGCCSKFTHKDMLDILGDYSPSWGEINYFAFDVPSVEFHIELFNRLHQKAADNNKSYDNGSFTVSKNKISSFDGWLIQEDPQNAVNNNHVNSNRGYKDKSMSTYIRNYIDHPGDDPSLPEGQKRQKPTMEEIRKSIESMIDIYNKNFI